MEGTENPSGEYGGEGEIEGGRCAMVSTVGGKSAGYSHTSVGSKCSCFKCFQGAMRVSVEDAEPEGALKVGALSPCWKAVLP